MIKTTNQAVVVPIVLKPHPHADSLSMVDCNGYTVVVKTQDWLGVSQGVFIPPENYVPIDRPEFSFLKKGDKSLVKVKAIKLRGIFSQGLLVPAREGMNVGDDVSEAYGIVHFDDEAPLETKNKTDEIAPPEQFRGVPKYDIDSIYKYVSLFKPNESVFVTEKIHGSHWRATWCSRTRQFYVGSRKLWYKDSSINMYWQVFHREGEPIKDLCRAFPDHVIHGEAYGMAGHPYKYGIIEKRYRLAIFDIRRPDWSFFNPQETYDRCLHFKVKHVPVWYEQAKFNFEVLKDIAREKSFLNNNIPQEGIVVKPLKERQDPHVGRVIFKIISDEFKG